MKKEIVICSAIRWKGQVWRGHRHGDVMSVMREELSWNMTRKQITKECLGMYKEQGFVTSKNRYVTREEGLALQKDAGIESVAEGGYRGNILFSEDLY